MTTKVACGREDAAARRTGPELSTVGFGAWAIGGPWRFGWGEVDDDDSIAAIRRAIELGVNWVDTAAVYGLGHSEEVVGRAARPFRVGEDVLVFTKCGRRWEGRPKGVIENDLRPESIREECEQSLRRLGVERIDLYQFHWPDRTTGTALEDSWGRWSSSCEEGKVRWIGVANFDVGAARALRGIRHVDSVQPPLSLLARGARMTVLPWAAEHGTGVDRLLAHGLGSADGQHSIASGSLISTRTTGAASPRLSVSLRSDRTWTSSSGFDRSPPGSTRRLPELAVAWTLAQPG